MRKLIKENYISNDIWIGGQCFQVENGILKLEDNEYGLYSNEFKSVGFEDLLENNKKINQNIINNKEEKENDSDEGSGLSSTV